MGPLGALLSRGSAAGIRAVRLHRFGEPLRVDTVPAPAADGGEVVVEVAYAGVNPIDVWLTQGLVAGGRQRLPMIPGSDAAGMVGERRVVVHGSGLGVMRDGLYAERARVPASAVVDIPEGVDLRAAAAVGVPGSTAWILVNRMATVTPDDRVLVLGCTGGVGSLLVQLAANLGASVTGQSSSAEKGAFIADALGCDVAVADASGLAAVLDDLEPTVVFDALGSDFTAALVHGVAPGARIVVFGTSAAPLATLDLRALYKKGVSLVGYGARRNPPGLTSEAVGRVLGEMAAGRVRAFVDDVLGLEDAQRAHDRVMAKAVTGKLLLQP